MDIKHFEIPTIVTSPERSKKMEEVKAVLEEKADKELRQRIILELQDVSSETSLAFAELLLDKGYETLSHHFKEKA